MNKQELIEKLIEKTGEAKAEKVLNAFVDIVEETVADGDSVKLVGFGTFVAKSRAEKTIKTPAGLEYMIPERRVPVFKVSKLFKDAVNK